MLKILRKGCISAVFSVLIFSCSDDALNVDNSMQPVSDLIDVYAQQFAVTSAWTTQESVPSRINTDYFLVGSLTDKIFGQTNAEILAQFAPPTDLRLPANVDSTSLSLELKINSYQAVGDSIVNINVYKFDTGKTFSYRGNYSSDIDPSEYSTKSEKIGSVQFKAGSSAVVIRLDQLNEDLKNQLLDAAQKDNSIFTNETTFTDFLKGLYIEVESGNAMLSVNAIDMYFYARYKNTAGIFIGQNSIFPANKEVRQVNRIERPNINNLPQTDSVMFVSSPAGTVSEVSIPLGAIADTLGIEVVNGIAYAPNGRKLSVNSAIMTISVADTASQKITPPPYLLLIKKSLANDFFAKDKDPDNTTAMIGFYDQSTASYSFSLHRYLANELKNELAKETVDQLQLIPVDGVYNSTYGVLTNIRYAYNFYAASLCTEKHPTKPIKFDILISGF